MYKVVAYQIIFREDYFSKIAEVNINCSPERRKKNQTSWHCSFLQTSLLCVCLCLCMCMRLKWLVFPTECTTGDRMIQGIAYSLCV